MNAFRLACLCLALLFTSAVATSAHEHHGGYGGHGHSDHGAYGHGGYDVHTPHVNEFYFNYQPNPYSPYDYEFQQPYGFGYYYTPGYGWSPNIYGEHRGCR